MDLISYDWETVVLLLGGSDDCENREDREDDADHDGDDPADDDDPGNDQRRAGGDEHHDAVVDVIFYIVKILIRGNEQTQEPKGTEIGHNGKCHGCAGYVFDGVALKIILGTCIVVVHVILRDLSLPESFRGMFGVGVLGF